MFCFHLPRHSVLRVDAGLPNVRVVGVCAEGARCMKNSFDQQRPIDTASADIAARVAIPEVVEAMLPVVDEMELVTEHDLNHFMWLLQETEGIVA